jgi:hypothetical protein
LRTLFFRRTFAPSNLKYYNESNNKHINRDEGADEPHLRAEQRRAPDGAVYLQ